MANYEAAGETVEDHLGAIGSLGNFAVTQSVLEQFDGAVEGYNAVMSALPDSVRAPEPLRPNAIAKGLAGWLTAERIDCVAMTVDADPTQKCRLVVTPNVATGWRDLEAIAMGLGGPSVPGTHTRQEYYQVDGDNDFYSRYTEQDEQELSDPDNGMPVIFRLVPEIPDQNSEGTVAQQQRYMAELQKRHPVLTLSPLDAMAYWATLRAAGVLPRNAFSDGKFRSLTDVRHIDARPISHRYDEFVPITTSVLQDVRVQGGASWRTGRYARIKASNTQQKADLLRPSIG